VVSIKFKFKNIYKKNKKVRTDRTRLGMRGGRLARARLIDTPLRPHGSRLRPSGSSHFSLQLSPPCSSFAGGDDWASGGAIVTSSPSVCRRRASTRYARPFSSLSAVRDGAPQTLSKLFVFGSESSYNILPTNFDFVCKNYRVYMCIPMSYTGPGPWRGLWGIEGEISSFPSKPLGE
jgi:hypothetical protein